MKILKHIGVFHFWPYCCAEQYIDNIYRKVNWIWLFWMFCFEPKVLHPVLITID